ncbi:MAG: family 20 glycosylhydrolase [Chloroflexi bacterium]|nr:family 20 glycosylhydrolase [Chloroflexota bacterium]
MQYLIPVPNTYEIVDYTFKRPIPLEGAISIPNPSLLFEAQWLQRVLAQTGRSYTIQLAWKGAHIHLGYAKGAEPQSYTLKVEDDIVIRGGDAAGVFYGCCTLRQLVLGEPDGLPILTIEDAPFFKHRGYMLDISRDRVPTLETLYQLVDELSAMKYNQLQLYIEHTFQFPGHREAWQHASPLTGEDILRLDAYCRQRHVELVPNQNSLGHMERFLKHGPYRWMAESPQGFDGPDGAWRGPSTLNPLLPDSLGFVCDLYDSLLPYYSSTQFNVGCDEPWELGRGKSKEAVAERGGRVYLDWILALHKEVTERGRTMMFWGDIILHYPELVPELPKDVIVMEWGYEPTHPFEENCAKYAAAGVPFYVCPGVSSWNSLVGRSREAMGNIARAALEGKKHGAIGLLVTDWGDRGHWQPWPVSYIGMAYAAAMAWSADVARQPKMDEGLDIHMYHDPAREMATISNDLASVYLQVGPPTINGQVLAYALEWTPENFRDKLAFYERWGGHEANISPDNLRAVIQLIDSIVARIDRTRMTRPDAALVRAEWTTAAHLLRHGAKWLLYLQGETDYSPADLLAEIDTLILQQRQNWLARSRPGGLDDSIRRFEPLRAVYAAAIKTSSAVDPLGPAGMD